MSSSDSVVIGYKYFIGMHLIFALSGIVNVRKIRSGDKTMLWEGSATTNSTISIDKPTVFGGDGVGGRGGFVANVDIEFGGDSQGVNSFLQSMRPGKLMPSYRRRFGMVFRYGSAGAYIGNTGSVEPIAMLATGGDSTADEDWRSDLRWIQASDAPFPDINPVHIIRDLITADDIGLGLSSSLVDSETFAAAANTLVNEGFGVSMLFSGSGSAYDHIQEVCRHINAVVFQDPGDGLFKIKLLRDDYGLSDLLTFDESNAVKKEFSRAGIGEQINRVVIVFHDMLLGRNDSVTIDDLALNDLHGGSPNSKEMQYTGISSKILATKVAGRDLKQLSAPIAKVGLELNRQASSLRPGDVFIWNNEELGISGMVLRIIKMSLGTPKSGIIKVDCIEDVFAYGTTRYLGANPSAWETEVSDAEAITSYLVTETPYFFYYYALGGIPYGFDATQGMVLSLAQKQTATDQSFDVLHRVSTANPYKTQYGQPFSQVGVLLSDVAQNTTAFTFDELDDLSQVAAGDAGYILDSVNNALEIVRVDSIAAASGGWDVTVGRGCADTVAITHLAGAKVLFFSASAFGAAGNDYDNGDAVKVKLLATNSSGRLAEGDASVINLTMAQRLNKPYPPGKLRINQAGTGTTVYPEAFMGTFGFTCATRDRLSQTGDLHDESEASITPEASVTHTARYYDEGGTLRKTTSGSAFTSDSWSTEEADCGLGRLNNTIQLKLKGARAGLDSYTEHDFTVDRADYGYSYGEYYGGY